MVVSFQDCIKVAVSTAEIPDSVLKTGNTFYTFLEELCSETATLNGKISKNYCQIVIVYFKLLEQKQ